MLHVGVRAPKWVRKGCFVYARRGGGAPGSHQAPVSGKPLDLNSGYENTGGLTSSPTGQRRRLRTSGTRRVTPKGCVVKFLDRLVQSSRWWRSLLYKKTGRAPPCQDTIWPYPELAQRSTGTTDTKRGRFPTHLTPFDPPKTRRGRSGHHGLPNRGPKTAQQAVESAFGGFYLSPYSWW